MIGAHVLSDLKRQRESIERNLNSLQRADEELDSSDRTLDQMLRRQSTIYLNLRIITSKLLMYIVGVLLVACLIYLLYRKLWK